MSPARPRAQNGHLVFERSVVHGSILQGDCLQIMPKLPTESVDLVLTDPPYVCRYRDRAGRTVANDDNTEWLKPAYAEMYRLLKPGSLCITFYGWVHTDAFFAAWRAAGFRIVGHMVFCKDYASSERTLRCMHESAYVLSKGRPPMVAPALSDVRSWGYTGNLLHPTQKPVDALKPLIDTYSRRGDMVLDPFAGSGSTLVAARDLGRRYLGIELDPVHAATAEKRLR